MNVLLFAMVNVLILVVDSLTRCNLIMMYGLDSFDKLDFLILCVFIIFICNILLILWLK